MSMKNDMTRDAANMKQGEPPMSMKNDMPRDEANITPVSIKGGAEYADVRNVMRR